VEVCLVLAPDVNFFLNSRKQGLPCQRSLFFFFFFVSAEVRKVLPLGHHTTKFTQMEPPGPLQVSI